MIGAKVMVKNKRSIILFYVFITLFVGYGLGLAALNIFMYAGAINNAMQSTAFMMIIPLVVIKKIENFSTRVIGVLLMILLLLCAVFFLNKPSVSYHQAVDQIIKDYAQKDRVISFVDTKKDSQWTEEKISFMVDKYYYMEFMIDQKVHYALYNPMKKDYKMLLKENAE